MGTLLLAHLKKCTIFALQDKLGLWQRSVSTLHLLCMSGGCQLLLLCSQAACEALQLQLSRSSIQDSILCLSYRQLSMPEALYHQHDSSSGWLMYIQTCM